MPVRRSPRVLALLPLLLGLSGLGSLLGGCASAPPAPPPVAAPAPSATRDAAERERAYLPDLAAGLAGGASGADATALAPARRALLQGDLEAARHAALEALTADPKSLPAQVLAAEADLVAGDFKAVVGRLVPVGDVQPGYTASQLVLGRAAELAGDLPLAYAAFRAVAARSPLAFSRTGELHPRAIEIVSNRLQEALRQGRVEEAEKQLVFLRAWAPAELVTLDAARSLAVARGDRRAELAAIKELVRRQPADRALAERQADLEFSVGDPSTGLQIVQRLADRYPHDADLAERLAAGKFRWRLSLLPVGVQDMGARPELDRAGLAVLLYWLIPEVRYAKPTAGRIATDVLDLPQREEVVRVVNLGLMDVDTVLHRFSPRAPARQATALSSLIRLLSRYGQQATCLGGADGAAGDGQPAVCGTAARCGLIASPGDCLPAAPLSGGDAVELIRRALKQLGRS